MKIINFIAAFLIVISASSCNFQYNIKSIDGNGNVIREEFKVAEKIDFIKASAGLEVEIVYGPLQTVIIEADENLHEYISAELNNGILNIKSTRNIRKAKAKKVTVIFVDIEGIHASSGSNVYTTSEVVSNSLDLKVSSGAKLNVSAVVKDLSAQSSSGGKLTIVGQVLNFNSKASSGSEIEARELKALYGNSRASSSASIFLNIERALDARASSSGRIQYTGEPEVINQKTSSSGSIRKM